MMLCLAGAAVGIQLLEASSTCLQQQLPLPVLHRCARPGQSGRVPGDFCSLKATTHHQTALLPTFSYGRLSVCGRQDAKNIFFCVFVLLDMFFIGQGVMVLN